MAGYAGSLTVVNTTGGPLAIGAETYPEGATVIPTDVSTGANPAITAMGLPGGEDWVNESYVLWVAVAGQTFYEVPRRDLLGAFRNGVGIGFLFYGFGWCYRLAKKVPSGSSYE